MFFYNTGVFFYTLVIYIASLFKPKAKLWVEGRRDWKNKLAVQLKKIEGHPRIWIHCASLGEFEQGRPLIELIKKSHPDHKIILSFFSPSGYEIRKNYEFADVICYLPKDTKNNAATFLQLCKPNSVIFVKYEFWLNYLFEIRKQKIPSFLISSVFKLHQPLFKWYGVVYVKALKTYTKIFVQDSGSLKLLEQLKISTATICGDTRIDRVLEIKENSVTNPLVEKFTGGNKTIIGGSVWPNDSTILIESFIELKRKHPGLKLILVPHEVDSNSIRNITQLLQQKKLSYSLYTSNKTNSESDVLIVDIVGILSSIYQYGKIAFIGGGFNDGIHNILEPAVYGLPVLFGPNNSKFIEAEQLIQFGGAFQVSDSEAIIRHVNEFLANVQHWENASQSCLNFILTNKGASEKILKQLF